ncbi:MAG: methylated-DNA--[protein]-cysteine S-methyltransferase [Propionicimonas sp.]|nr:methylated-DNA--[protein]-cysteine S-methyltransferase [Propionicimonas sp.]
MWTVIDSPIGPLRLVATDHALAAIEFSPFANQRDLGEQADDHPVLRAAASQLTEYFAGERTVFDLPLDPAGTDFQRRVWAELTRIGYGDTASYGEIAHRLGLTNAASRAVGAANGRNPIPIVVPCHRVIGADGTLTGYAGGIDRKRTLLDLERPTLL